MGFFSKLKEGLSKTKNSFDEKINNVFSHFRKVDEELLEELEEALIMSDVGMDTSLEIISNLRDRIKKEKIEDEEDVKRVLREEMLKLLDVGNNDLRLETTPSIILVVGVNGVGKTTSIGKIANKLVKEGKKVVIAAADTFRAAAVEHFLNDWVVSSLKSLFGCHKSVLAFLLLILFLHLLRLLFFLFLFYLLNLKLSLMMCPFQHLT